MKTPSMRTVALYLSYLVVFAGCTPAEPVVDADLFFSVCYRPDMQQSDLDRCAAPETVLFDSTGDGVPDVDLPNACDEDGLDDGKVIANYEYAIKTHDDGTARVFSDGAVLGDGSIFATTVNYESPTYVEQREGGEIEWYLSGTIRIFDGQGGEEPCPGAYPVPVPAEDRSQYCVEGAEILWVVSSTVEGFPPSGRASCNQVFVLDGERLEN